MKGIRAHVRSATPRLKRNSWWKNFCIRCRRRWGELRNMFQKEDGI
jgi:hypothetical protein